MTVVWQIGNLRFTDTKYLPSDVESRKVRLVKKLSVAIAKPIYVDYGKNTELLMLRGKIKATEAMLKMMTELADNSYMQPVHVKLPMMNFVEGEYVVKECSIKPVAGTVDEYEYKYMLWRVGGIYAEYYNVMQMMREQE